MGRCGGKDILEMSECFRCSQRKFDDQGFEYMFMNDVRNVYLGPNSERISEMILNERGNLEAIPIDELEKMRVVVPHEISEDKEKDRDERIPFSYELTSSFPGYLKDTQVVIINIMGEKRDDASKLIYELLESPKAIFLWWSFFHERDGLTPYQLRFSYKYSQGNRVMEDIIVSEKMEKLVEEIINILEDHKKRVNDEIQSIQIDPKDH
jgi:predicted RNA-binding protein